MNDNNEILAEIASIQKMLSPFFSAHPEILAAYVFGSTAMGKARPASDVDIAIRLVFGLSPEFCFNLKLTLMDGAERLLGRKTDIVILNNASLKMIRQVLRHGVLLYADAPEKEYDYAVLKQKEYFDFKYYIEKYRLELKSFFGAI